MHSKPKMTKGKAAASLAHLAATANYQKTTSPILSFRTCRFNTKGRCANGSTGPVSSKKALHRPGVLSSISNPSTPVETRSETQGYPQLCMELEASLGFRGYPHL